MSSEGASVMGEENGEKSVLVPRLRFPKFSDVWRADRIGEIADIFKGKGIAKSDISNNGIHPCIRYGELYTVYGELVTDVLSKTSLPATDLFFGAANDVIIPSSGETKEDIATAACVIPDGIAFGGDLNVLRTKEHGAFLSYYLNGPLRKGIARVAQGDSVVHLYPHQIEKLPIAVPDRREQQEIADCLSSLDELITAETQKLDALKTHKQGLMQQLFPREGETVPHLRFPEFREAGKWEDEQLENLAKRGSGHTPSKAHTEYYDGGIKWVSLADSKRLDAGFIKETAIAISAKGIENSSAVLHPAGSVLLSRDAAVGKSAVMGEAMAVSQHFIVWACKPTQLSNWFLYYTLQQRKPLFERMATGSTIKTIGLPFFIDMRIEVPTLPEQEMIAACLRSLDDLIAAQSQKIDALKTHKKGLMQQLFPVLDEVRT